MNAMLTAGGLALLTVAAHSVLGERLIFSRLRRAEGWTDEALNLLPVRRWWALRGSWHLLSIFGLGFAALLFDLGAGQSHAQMIIGITFLASAVYWAVATRLGHPAWIALGTIGALMFVRI